MSVFNDRDARSKLSASNKGRCVLGGIVLLVSVDREKQCWVSCRQPSLRRSAIALKTFARGLIEFCHLFNPIALQITNNRTAFIFSIALT